jgi:hypothetical protein
VCIALFSLVAAWDPFLAHILDWLLMISADSKGMMLQPFAAPCGLLLVLIFLHLLASLHSYSIFLHFEESFCSLT